MRKSAIFDLDGTFIPKRSAEKILIGYLLKQREIYPIDIFRTIYYFFANIGQWDKMILQNKYYLKGKSLDRLKELAAQCFLPQINELVSEKIREKVQLHKHNGDFLIFISGTPSFILELFSKNYFFDASRGTNLKVKNGKFTGEIEGIHPYGHRKLMVLDEFAKNYELDLAKSTVYANSFVDRFVMEKVGNPVAVNPDKNLLRYALNHNWDILDA